MWSSAKKYITDKITKSVTGKIIKYAFWSTVMFLGPIEVISTVGLPIAVTTAVVVHSGIIELGASKIVNKVVE